MKKFQLIKNNNLKIKTFFSVRIIIFSFTFYTLLYALIKNEWFKVRFNTTNAKSIENFTSDDVTSHITSDDVTSHITSHLENHVNFNKIGNHLKNNIGVIREHILQFTIKLFDDIKSELLHTLNDKILSTSDSVDKFRNAKLEFENFRDDFTAETKHFIEKIIWENKDNIASIELKAGFKNTYGSVISKEDIKNKVKNQLKNNITNIKKESIKNTINNVRNEVFSATENLQVLPNIDSIDFDSNNMTDFLNKNKENILSDVTNTLEKKSILHHKDLLIKLSKYDNSVSD